MKIRNNLTYILILALVLITSSGYSQTNRKEIRQRQKLAYEYEQLGDFDSALRIFQELYQKNPNDYVAFEGVKRILIAQNRLDEAIQFLESRLKRRYDLRIQSDLGGVYYMNENKKQAFRIWDEVLEKDQEKASAYQYVARAMLKNRLSEKAIEVFLNGRRQLRDENLFAIELANLYAAQNDYKNATIEFLKNYRQNPRQYTFIKLNLSRFVAEEPESAPTIIRILNQEIQENSGANQLRDLLVDIYLTNGDYENAFNEMVKLDKHGGQHTDKKHAGKALYEFGNKVLNDGEFFYAERAFNLLMQKHPKSVYAEQALFGLARSYQLQENHRQALEAYEQLIQHNHRSYQAQEALFQIGDVKLFEQLKPIEAREAYLKILNFYRRGDKRDKAVFRIGDCYFVEGNLSEARIWYEKPLKRRNASLKTQINALYKLVLTDLTAAKFDEAEKRINLILEKANQKGAPSNLTQVNDALEWSLLLNDPSKNVDTFGLYTQTILLERQHKFKEAIDLLQVIIDKHADDPIADEALLKQAEYYRELGNYVNSINSFQLLIKNYPESHYSDLAKMKIGKIYEQDLAQTEKALQAYEAFLLEFPRSMYIEEVRRRIRELEKNL